MGYSELSSMMSHYNTDFDERKYWAYGCNCMILGDRPMSHPGHGQPIDALDAVCKQYKDCNSCARLTHGDTCIGEFVNYQYTVHNGDVTCKNTPDSCERALCECDAQFAQDHVAHTDEFDNKFHMFWSSDYGMEMWDPVDSCPKGEAGKYDEACCAPEEGGGP